MKYKVEIDKVLDQIILRKYTNKDKLKDEYFISKNNKNELECTCFKFMRERNCKHVDWFIPILR